MAKELIKFDNKDLASYLDMYHFPSVCGGCGYVATFIDGYSAPVLLHLYNKDGENLLQIEGHGGNDPQLLIRLWNYFAYHIGGDLYMLYYRSCNEKDGTEKVWYRICKEEEEEG
ncbi:MAG: hypothetical protein MJZ82_01930 [Paludibacteraceae bacterium]|nr:hypothetical protein [Paludibacteraceae bacterium]